ncbi:MAG: cytochrome c1 [Burkholderiaceae bacterium]
MPASAAGGGYPLDTFPVGKLDNLPALQNGAKLFVNYCLGCHSTSLMRYNRLQDIGLTPDQIKANLMFTGSKVGDPMSIAMTKADAKAWFGAAPPDLSVITRARSSGAGSGSDWVYTFLRSYYRDGGTATGWNNALFPNVGMPHVLWELQGARKVNVTEIKSEGDHGFMQTIASYDSRGTASIGEATELSGHRMPARPSVSTRPAAASSPQSSTTTRLPTSWPT